jgi:hypothetical protein
MKPHTENGKAETKIGNATVTWTLCRTKDPALLPPIRLNDA